MMNFCPKCQGETKTLTFEDLPEKKQKEFKDDKEEIVSYEYCPNCKDHRAFSGGGFGNEFGDYDISFPPPTQKRTTPVQSLNSPCQCGSGKKYKRCCGAA